MTPKTQRKRKQRVFEKSLSSHYPFGLLETSRISKFYCPKYKRWWSICTSTCEHCKSSSPVSTDEKDAVAVKYITGRHFTDPIRVCTYFHHTDDPMIHAAYVIAARTTAVSLWLWWFYQRNNILNIDEKTRSFGMDYLAGKFKDRKYERIKYYEFGWKQGFTPLKSWMRPARENEKDKLSIIEIELQEPTEQCKSLLKKLAIRCENKYLKRYIIFEDDLYLLKPHAQAIEIRNKNYISREALVERIITNEDTST